MCLAVIKCQVIQRRRAEQRGGGLSQQQARQAGSLMRSCVTCVAGAATLAAVLQRAVQQQLRVVVCVRCSTECMFCVRSGCRYCAECASVYGMMAAATGSWPSQRPLVASSLKQVAPCRVQATWLQQMWLRCGGLQLPAGGSDVPTGAWRCT